MPQLLTVGYWHLHPLPNLQYKHMESFPYSVDKRNEIIDTILNAGYSVMIRPHNIYEYIIWIDKGRFGQS